MGTNPCFLNAILNMKFFPAFIIIIILLNQSGRAQIRPEKNKSNAVAMNVSTQKENALAHAIFSALAKNDDNGWPAMYPTNDEFKTILQRMLHEETPELTKTKMDEMLQQREKEATVCYKNEYREFMKQAGNLGINWKNAVFEKFEYDASPAEKLNLLYLNGKIFFSCKQQQFVIEGIEAIKMDAGCRLQAVKGIKRL